MIGEKKKVFLFISKFFEVFARYFIGSLTTIFVTSIGVVGSFASIQSHFDSLASSVDCESPISKFDNFIHCYRLFKFKTPFELVSSSIKIILWSSFLLSTIVFFYTIIIIFKNSVFETINLFLNKYENLTNKIQNLQDIQNVENLQINKLHKICLIGTSNAGKSVCLHRLANKVKDPRVTTSPYGIIMPADNNEYCLVLDAPGRREELQQSNVDFSQNNSNSSILLIFLDHNKSDTDSKVDLNRLLEHEEFIENFKTYLTDQIELNNLNQFYRIYFIINKSDLWKTNSKYKVKIPAVDSLVRQLPLFTFLNRQENQKTAIKKWGNRIIKSWQNQDNPKLAEEIEIRDHSNISSKDINGLRSLIIESINRSYTN